MPEISVLIPTLNEAGNIDVLVHTLLNEPGLGSLSRFSGIGVDLAAFWLLRSMAASLASVHFGTFLVATIRNFVLNYRWGFAGQFNPDRSAVRRYAAFLVVALLSLTLRGGVLAALTDGFDIKASLAILPAVALTALVNYLGSIFYAFPADDAENNPETRWRMGHWAWSPCSDCTQRSITTGWCPCGWACFR